MDFKDFYKEELIVEGNGIAFIGNGSVFGYILGKLNLKAMPVYLDERARVIIASRNAYQKLMDGFAISYKQYLEFKDIDKPKKDYKDDKKALFGKKETIQSKRDRSKFKKFASKFSKSFVKNAYKGVLKQDSNKIGDYDEIVSVMVYTLNNGGVVVFINTIEDGSDRYFISADEKADRFFLSNTGTSIAAYVTKYGDRTYRSPKFFDNTKKYSDDDLLDVEDGKPELDIGYHYDATAANKYDIKNVEPDVDHYYQIELDPHDYQTLLDQLDYLKNKKGVNNFKIHNISNLKGQGSGGKWYTFPDGSVMKRYYGNRKFYLQFSSDAAYNNAIAAGVFNISGLAPDLQNQIKRIQK